MCFYCSQPQGADPLSIYDLHDVGLPSLTPAGSGASGLFAPGGGGGGSGGAGTGTYSWDQIATYLTHGYWASTGSSPFSFVLDGSRIISYTFAALSSGAQMIAEYALDVWSAATGITFENTGTVLQSFTETGDAGGTISGSFAITGNSILQGSIRSSGDTDYYRVNLVAGETYVISLARLGSSGLDPVLELRGPGGAVLEVSDDPSGTNAGEYITYTATGSGSYYVVARGYGTSQGNYELTVQLAPDLMFHDADPTGAYAWSITAGGAIRHSFINIHDRWDSLNLNGYMLQTYIHEIGHALGLGHTGPYNGHAIWGVSNSYDNDSWSASVMSYFSQLDNPFDPSGLATLATIMPADLIAIQNLYGAGSSGYQSGNTVWGPGGNIGGALQMLLDMWGGVIPANSAIYTGAPFAFMVYDTGGIDTLDFSVFAQNQIINLTELVRSNVGGGVGNMVIARGTMIENATGGAGHDVITGNDAGNRLSGNGGNDTLYGGAGNDSLVGGPGADRLYGGSGRDRAVYSDAGAGLRVDFLTPAVNSGDAAGDTYFSIEDLEGSAHNDSLLGDHAPNRILGAGGDDIIYGRGGDDTLFGGNGNDTLVGGHGADILDGGPGRDRALYSDAPYGLRVDFLTPSANTGYAAGDTFISIEDLQGSSHSDSLLGDHSANRILGAAGNDIIYGRGGDDTLFGGNGNDTLVGGHGADILDGGSGRDRALYSDATYGIRVDLMMPETNTGIAAGDIFISIEDLQGSSHSDLLLGDNAGNRLLGAAGNDTIYGRGGDDTIYGGSGDDVIYGNTGNDVLFGGSGADSFVFNAAPGPGNLDHIGDFVSRHDRIWLDDAVFTALSPGALAATAFASGLTATTAEHRIIYNQATGQIFYDADGNGAGEAILFATLVPGTALAASDFMIV